MTVYLPCVSGVVAVQASRSPPALRVLWSSGVSGGPPILAAGLVWTVGHNGVLYGLDPATGRIRQQAPIGVPANHFPTASVAGGLLLAPAARRVVAFSTARPGPPATASPPPSPSHPVSQPQTPAGGLPAGAIAGIVAGALVVIGGIGWLLWRRRATGRG